jgi:hypothetical protein
MEHDGFHEMVLPMQHCCSIFSAFSGKASHEFNAAAPVAFCKDSISDRVGGWLAARNGAIRHLLGGALGAFGMVGCLIATTLVANAQPASISFDGKQFVRQLVRDQGANRIVEYYLSGRDNDNWTERMTFTWLPHERIKFSTNKGTVTIDDRSTTRLLPVEGSDRIDLRCQRFASASQKDGGLIFVQYDRRFEPRDANYVDVMALRSQVADAMAWVDLGPMRMWLADQQATAARSELRRHIDELRRKNEDSGIIFPR